MFVTGGSISYDQVAVFVLQTRSIHGNKLPVLLYIYKGQRSATIKCVLYLYLWNQNLNGRYIGDLIQLVRLLVEQWQKKVWRTSFIQSFCWLAMKLRFGLSTCSQQYFMWFHSQSVEFVLWVYLITLWW